jgi:hypothetical protein
MKVSIVLTVCAFVAVSGAAIDSELELRKKMKFQRIFSTF